MRIGVWRHEVLAVQVNAVSIAKTGVAAIRQSRPADAADHVDAEAEDDEYRDRRIEMEVGAGNHRGDDQCDDEREKLKHGDRLRPASKERLAQCRLRDLAKEQQNNALDVTMVTRSRRRRC
jgi:hypothetical protein